MFGVGRYIDGEEIIRILVRDNLGISSFLPIFFIFHSCHAYVNLSYEYFTRASSIFFVHKVVLKVMFFGKLRCLNGKNISTIG